jgi:YD repeat-containing protein
VTDELGNYTESKTDLYGRLAWAREVASDIPANDYSRATYVYDELDRLVKIEHNGKAGIGKQERIFGYDGYGRLVSETTPEAGTMSYSYKANDLLDTSTNANGKATTYNYNKRNLVTTIGYSDATPGVGYQYDAYGARTQMNDGEGQTSYVYNSLRQLQSETRTFTGLAGNNYVLSYSYNQGDQVKSVNYQITGGYGGGAPFTQNGGGTANCDTCQLSGTITNAQGQPLAGVTVGLSSSQGGTTATTNSSGQYSFSVAVPGNYTLTPTLAGYVFDPSSRTYNNLGGSVTNANFTALPPVQTMFDKKVNYGYNNVGALSGVGTNLIGTDPNNTSNVISNL